MKTHPRENNPFYIAASDDDIQQMLNTLNLQDLSALYGHIDSDVLFDEFKLYPHLNKTELKDKLIEISNKNSLKTSFLGDTLQQYSIPNIVYDVCNIRGLTTAYTPYQPERSQGTLQSLWLYQNAISSLTGFEAINASLYERSTCLFEALSCASRIKKKNTVLIASNILQSDKDVIETLAIETPLVIKYIKVNSQGEIDQADLIEKIDDQVCAFAFSQINQFGFIEDFHALTDLAHKHNILAISIIDPMAITNNALEAPAFWGENGADLLVAEGQHLTLDPNFGGPGLGIFGIRYNDKNKMFIRQAAGRFIGKSKDEKGRDCKVIILSTREQHIRRDKATSNICSNQSFIATACGASLLNQGSEGLSNKFKIAHQMAQKACQELLSFQGINLLYNGSFANEFTVTLNKDVDEVINLACDQGLHIGVALKDRSPKENSLKISFNDTHSNEDVDKLISFFSNYFEKGDEVSIKSIPENYLRKNKFHFASIEESKLLHYYQKLGDQNLSPDDGLYPLGSCTMKYNPFINDWAAGLEKFRMTHPQAPLRDVQGNLEILYTIQESFKAITGLPGCTTQPVAGAQGELVGIKLFQAYHRDHSQTQRNIIIIPKSAHGTNPATATMAGFETKKIDGKQIGIITVDASETGEINLEQVTKAIEENKDAIAGIMITNPNTAGIFETNFAKVAKMIHEVGGLVYMDGANMNAIAGWVDLNKLGVDAVHNNLHKTWSIPHGGGGPGDAIVAVSEKLIDYLPGVQITKENDIYSTKKQPRSIGEFHRNYGNFAHKVRAYTYIRALGTEGIRKMSAVAVLSARYLYKNLSAKYPMLPIGGENTPRMHEFILTISPQLFQKLADAGTPKSMAIARIGKLFLNFGFHAPTVAFPEVYGLMIEPTESYSKSELDGFMQVVDNIFDLLNERPEILQTVPHFTPIDRVDEVAANKNPILSEENFENLSEIIEDRIKPDILRNLAKEELAEKIICAHDESL